MKQILLALDDEIVERKNNIDKVVTWKSLLLKGLEAEEREQSKKSKRSSQVKQ
jgi:hypothetical protein